ncbi:MAG: terminase family protein, partial [Deltaproteobacteria bacterium]|nr:terminase family protein [Deltaproteobacteria bacterium]
MLLDLNQCDPTCKSCVSLYFKKHKVKQGTEKPFRITCEGIPLNYIPDSILAAIGGDPELAISTYDPVVWARKFLDWHCEDPDGEVWKRKTLEHSLPPEAASYDKERAEAGKSIFHRPYQADMLRCAAKYKAFRIGRQAGKTETLCIAILWALYTHEKFKVVLICPYQAQVEMIFGRLEDLISSSSLLSDAIARNAKAPNFQIKLFNGSRVNGFTAGTRSGQDAGAARGQPANMLVFDEADYLSPGDIQATLATIVNFDKATVWMSSTPTGRREKFYESCNNRIYREFYYSSMVNPNWTPEKDEFFKSEYTDEQYRHEILAEFGEQEEGVYQVKYVEAAQAEYEYAEMTPQPTWTYMIGVDWNDVKIGTTIAIVGHNPHDGLFYIVDKHTISRAERTQLAACNKIAELNRLWRPAAIYVDQGYGATQIEVLQGFGATELRTKGPNHPDARLRNIVKGYDFGSSIEIRDLFTKQAIKKPAKPFLVETSVRRFEQQQMRYPASDEKYTAQLLGYVIQRVSITGRPVFEQQNEKAGDHLLDAVNLALVAFALEKSEFGKPTYMQHIAFGGQFGDNKKQRPITDARDNRPKQGRAAVMTDGNQPIIPSAQGDLPAANHSVESGICLWNWPGFGHDAPKPRVRTL